MTPQSSGTPQPAPLPSAPEQALVDKAMRALACSMRRENFDLLPEDLRMRVRLAMPKAIQVAWWGIYMRIRPYGGVRTRKTTAFRRLLNGEKDSDFCPDLGIDPPRAHHPDQTCKMCIKGFTTADGTRYIRHGSHCVRACTPDGAPGRIRVTTEYVNGVRHGLTTVWCDNQQCDGCILETFRCMRGWRHGINREWVLCGIAPGHRLERTRVYNMGRTTEITWYDAQDRVCEHAKLIRGSLAGAQVTRIDAQRYMVYMWEPHDRGTTSTLTGAWICRYDRPSLAAAGLGMSASGQALDVHDPAYRWNDSYIVGSNTYYGGTTHTRWTSAEPQGLIARARPAFA